MTYKIRVTASGLTTLAIGPANTNLLLCILPIFFIIESMLSKRALIPLFTESQEDT